MSGVPQSEEFQKAVIDSRKLKAKPTSDELLQLYGLYKQAIQDPPIEKSEKPGMFDLKVINTLHPLLLYEPQLNAEPSRLKGKAKKNAWQQLVEEGVTPKEAQSRYVTLVEKLKETYGYDADKEPEPVGAGP